MKQHLVVSLKPRVSLPPLASWHETMTDKGGAGTRLTPGVDAVLRRHGVPVWATREHTAAAGGERWSADETAAGLNRIYRLVLRDDTAVPARLIDDVRLEPEVQYARLGQVALTDLAPARSFSVQTDTWSREAIGLPEAHIWGEGDPEITVAVLDTGVDQRHPELQDALVPGQDFVDILDGADRFFSDFLGVDSDPADPVGHGSHVSGIIAASGRAMPRGVAPCCRLVPVRVLGAMKQGGRPVGAGLVDNINTALKWAVDQGADIINMSFGLPNTGGGLPHREVVEYGRRRGVVMVAAAGNDGREKLYYPGSLPGVFAIGATDPEDQVAVFSTYGPQVLITAPGTDIYSAFRDGGYAFASGTSQASPFVTGAAALLQSSAVQRTGRRLAVDDVRRLLVRTADRPDRQLRTLRGGYGRLNIGDAMRLLDRSSSGNRRLPSRTQRRSASSHHTNTTVTRHPERTR